VHAKISVDLQAKVACNYHLIFNFVNHLKMRNLDLNAYGVSEMNAAEMQKVDGGFWQIMLGVLVGCIIDACLDMETSIADFERGRKSVGED
jgi:lactobin A/cerein 7B family class IIb bacteriocin